MSPNNQFRERPFEERLNLMGDLAENAFCRWADQNNIRHERYGLDRPNFELFRYLSPELRHTPDFICEQLGTPPKLARLRNTKSKFARHFLVETKGCGRDQIVKIKHQEFEVMKRWEQFSQRPVVVFVYDSENERVSTSLITSMIEHLSGEVETGAYYDGGPPKTYMKIPTSALQWEPIAATEAQA